MKKRKWKDPGSKEAFGEIASKLGLKVSQSHLHFRRLNSRAFEAKREVRQRLVSLWSEKKGSVSTAGYAYLTSLKRAAYVFGGKKGKGAKKAMIVEAQFKDGKRCWIYYPKPSEALRFAEAMKHMPAKDIAQNYPGSVGIVFGELQPECELFRLAKVDAIQGSFSKKKCPELSQFLTSKHGGWRQHVLGWFFGMAKRENIQRVTFRKPSPSEEITAERIKRQVAILLNAAKQNGFNQVESYSDNLIVVERKKD
jgi:hypothetical protein